MDANQHIARIACNNPEFSTLKASGRTSRASRRQVLHAIVRSIREKTGRTFVLIPARQSGRNELQAQGFVTLLAVLSQHPLNIVSLSPTLRLQAFNALHRLGNILDRRFFTPLSGGPSGASCASSAGTGLSSSPAAAPRVSPAGPPASSSLWRKPRKIVVPLRFDRRNNPRPHRNQGSTILTYFFLITRYSGWSFLYMRL
jgi:hypothetical protein